MTTEPDVKLYDVWRLPFAYEDQPDVLKERPVVVGSIDCERSLALVVKVTGHGPRSEFPGEVRLEDWKRAGLSKPSVAHCSKVLLVPFTAFRGLKRYGHLAPTDAVAVASALKSLGKTFLSPEK